MSVEQRSDFRPRLIFNSMMLIWLSTSCAPIEFQDTSHAKRGGEDSIFDAANVIQENWRHLPLRGKTDYRLAAGDNGVAIKAEGKNAASGLIRSINVDTQNCPILQWRWRVEQLQHDADLRDKKKEDVAASIFLLFGDPGFMSSPQPVPTLRYVWTNARHSKNDVIDNPYLPGVVRSIVIRSGEIGDWFTEKRNLRDDYKLAFGTVPTEKIHAIALFTDNDQTKEPATAYYRWARVQCIEDSLSDGVKITGEVMR